MGKNNKAIIDNSVLRALYYLNLLPGLVMIYKEIYVPREVEKEFLRSKEDGQERYAFLMEFYAKNIWFKQCQSYREDAVAIFLSYQKKIHRGEAEVMVQNQSMANVHEVLLDDKEARRVAETQCIKIRGTLSILAFLDIKMGYCKYYDSVKILMEKYKARYSKEVIDRAYRNAKKEALHEM